MNPGQTWVLFLGPLYLIRFDSNRDSNRTFRLCEQRAQAVERLLLHRWQDVGVGVEGQRDLAVPQQLLDDLGMNPEREQEAGRAMPQAVEGDRWHSSPGQQRAKRSFEQIGDLDRVTHCIAKDPALLIPERSCGELPFALTGPVALERLEREVRQVDAPAALRCLRLSHFETLARDARDRSSHLYRFTREIHIFPREPQEFPLPHACGESEDIQGFEGIALCCGEELQRLFDAQRLHLLLRHAWRIHSIADVAGNQNSSAGRRGARGEGRDEYASPFEAHSPLPASCCRVSAAVAVTPCAV